jgi:hypothetical protein
MLVALLSSVLTTGLVPLMANVFTSFWRREMKLRAQPRLKLSSGLRTLPETEAVRIEPVDGRSGEGISQVISIACVVISYE